MGADGSWITELPYTVAGTFSSCACVKFRARVCQIFIAGIVAAKSNDAVLHKAERRPARASHCHLRELPADEPVTAAVRTHSAGHDWSRSATTALALITRLLVHGQVTIIFIVSVCLFVCLFVCLSVCCAEFFSAVFDPISIKLGHMLYVWV